MDYLLKEDVNATDELADRVSEYDSADFHNENVQTAVEDIQIEKKKNLSLLIHMNRNLSYNFNMK